MDDLTHKARNLRKNSTRQEKILWERLRGNRYKNLGFRRQYVIGNYIVDFICKQKKLIIELDGGQHNEPTKIVYDENRTKYLETMGYKVVRFWNNEIDNNLEGVFKVLDNIIGN